MTDRQRRRTDLDALVLDPAAHFSSPQEVLAAPGLTDHARLRILESWAEEAKHISESEAENMTGGTPPRLREATLALLALRQRMSGR